MSGTTITITGNSNSSNLVLESTNGSINSTESDSSKIQESSVDLSIYAASKTPTYGVANFDMLLNAKQLRWYLDSYDNSGSCYQYDKSLPENLSSCAGIGVRKTGPDSFFTNHCCGIYTTADDWNKGGYGINFEKYFNAYAFASPGVFTADFTNNGGPGSAGADYLIDKIDSSGLSVVVQSVKNLPVHAQASPENQMNDRMIGDIMIIAHLWLAGFVPVTLNDFVDGASELIAGLPASKLELDVNGNKKNLCDRGQNMLRQHMTVHPDGVDMIAAMVKANPPSGNPTWTLAVDRKQYNSAKQPIDSATEEGWPILYLNQCASFKPIMHPLFPVENSQRSIVYDSTLDITTLTITS